MAKEGVGDSAETAYQNEMYVAPKVVDRWKEIHWLSNWGTQARPSGAPKQQAAEAMPSSRGDARAAGRARLPGGGFRTPEGDCVLRFEFDGLRSRGSSALVETRIGICEL
jgi:hypothetical protein